MKKLLLISAMAFISVCAFAQGGNTSMGGEEGDFDSLTERVLKLEKKTDAFQVYFNYAGALQSGEMGANAPWTTKFTNKQLRLEIKGTINNHLFYRFRHRLNRSNSAMGEDNFAKATDIMLVGWQFNEKWSISVGKMCQMWGGFEFDENPMYIYQYSDFIDNMDNFMAGGMVSYRPVPSQEIVFMISNANNGKFGDEWGPNPYVFNSGVSDISNLVTKMTSTKAPLTYILNWNGSFFEGKLNTRWAGGVQTQAEGMYSYMLTLGQQLNLPKFQWYVDYMGEWDDVDRLKIATSELSMPELTDLVNVYFGKVQYHSIITKANWQFADKWNLMVKGMYEMASVTDSEQYKDYRKSFGYIGALEYYPMKGQDFRVSLSYIGRTFTYSEASGLSNFNTNRIELGFMYRIKAF